MPVAVQSNGITVARVDDVAWSVRFLVGNAELVLYYVASADRFYERFRGWLDGRRAGRPSFSGSDWTNMVSQAHGIARDHGWKRGRVQEAR